MKREIAREIDRKAADWAAKVDRGLSPEEQAELDAWLNGDVRRVGAYARMRAIAMQTERAAALGPTYSPAAFASKPPIGPTRRAALWGGGAIAASLAGAGALTWLMRDRFHTGKGEIRQIALEDGSVITLNTASTVLVRFSRRRRSVRLLAGEALFDVASDRTRPFVVEAGATEATAVGTSFTVRRLPGQAVQVLVCEGLVEVDRKDARAGGPVRLKANMRAVSFTKAMAPTAPALTTVALADGEVHRALAWRDGRIAFEGETLAAAAAEFERYSDVRIVVDDPSLASQEIAGLYQVNDPFGFARSVAASLNARTQVSDGEVRIYLPQS
jgi:transmembrane sensor